MKLLNKLFLLLLFVLLPMNLIANENNSQQTLGKIDPSLRILMSKLDKGLQIDKGSVEVYRQSLSSPPIVAVLIKAEEDIRSHVESLGGSVGSVHGDIYTARLPIAAVIPAAELEITRYIEASRVLYPELSLSVPKTGASVLHNLAPSSRLTGKGVIIGITDSGIDISHEDFKDQDGNTRILFLWDQYAFGTRPEGFTYGAEYTADQINTGNVRHIDDDGHGSHVTGIAAGNGLSTGPYIGMAPEADIIMVVSRGNDIWNRGATTVGTLDGYDYIQGKAKMLGKRHVINTSLGTIMGPHDGTTLFEQAVNNDVEAGSIIVISAGNHANDGLHAEVFVTPNEPVTIDFQVIPDREIEGGEIALDIWYESNDNMDIEIAGPNTEFQPTVTIFGNKTFDTADGNISVLSEVFSPLNFDNRIMIVIDSQGSQATDIASGTWQIRLSASPGNNLPDGGEVDLWFERNDPVRFLNFVDIEETLGMPACADSAITVASYSNRTGSFEDISNFSSRGPRRDGVLKPDIAGLGGGVISVLSKDADDDPVGDDRHTQLSGTSMSAPHVAGAVALLLQADSSLTPGQVKRILHRAARSDEYTGSVPNTTWGYGKLNILSAAMPYVSNATVTGAITDKATQQPIRAEISFSFIDPPFEIPEVTVITDTITGNYHINLMPTKYSVTISPNLPYPEINIPEFTVSADTVTTLNVEFTPADILIVNGDPSGNYAQYYTEALDSLNKNYAVWDVSRKGALTATSLAVFDSKIVIWFTGDADTNVLSSNDREIIGSFLDQGGMLFLSGQNIAEDLTDSTFLSNRLHVSYVSNISDPTLDGISGDAVGDGLNLMTLGQFGANNQTSRDVIMADSLAVVSVVYDTTTGAAGGVSVEDPITKSKLVFFSFGFEAINTRSGLPFSSREQVLDNVIDWFLGTTLVKNNRLEPTTLPQAFLLGQNYPNPFSARGNKSTTKISYQLPFQTEMTIEVYNLLGQKVKTLVSRKIPAGRYTIQWDGRAEDGTKVANGIYIYMLRANNIVKTKKMIIIR